MRRPTNITIACVVILMIVVICVFAFSGNKKTSTNNEQNGVTNSSNEVVKNEIGENVENEIENTIINEEVQNEVENEVENVAASTETFTETPQTAEEKAVGIVRDDWKDEGVAYSVTGMDANGNYIVQVTDSNTEVLAFYTVNVGDGSFTKREMN